MKVCKQHKAKPAVIYGECVGCEIEGLHKTVTAEHERYVRVISESEATINALQEEIEVLTERVAVFERLTSEDVSIKELHITEGRFDMEATHPLAAALTASLVSVFKSAGAENYFEMEAYREDVGPIVITIQRREGKAPGRIISELKTENAELRTALRQIMDDNEQESHPCGPVQYGHFGTIAKKALDKTVAPLPLPVTV